MRLPKSPERLTDWTRDMVSECRISVPRRREAATFWQNLYFTGRVDGVDSKLNKCFNHVNKLSSNLFAASDIRLTLEASCDNDAKWEDRLRTASQVLTRIWRKGKIGQKFSLAVLASLIDGSSFLKTVWHPRFGPQAKLVRSHFMGVLREDIDDLAEQEAFTQSYYLTKPAFRRLIANNPDKNEIMANVRGSYAPAGDDILLDDYFHQIVAGGLQPIGVGASTGAVGQVNVLTSAPQPQLSIELAQELIRVDDLWVWDDDYDDWTTIRFAEPGVIIEGRYRRQNLSDAKNKAVPFVKVCPNEMMGYFWGRSELAPLVRAQGVINGRINDIDHVFRLQAKPPHAFSGFSGITQEKALALLTPGGEVTTDEPTGQVKSMAPQMPQFALEYLRECINWFDETAGFTPILSGQGDAGVRSQGQAATLLRTSSPRLRDRSFVVESQVEDVAQLILSIRQAKDASVERSDKAGEFLMSQLPADTTVRVDSHSASPAFQQDNTNMAFALAKIGAFDGEDVLETVQPPNTDRKIKKYRTREEQKAKFIAEHPEILSKQKPGPKPGSGARVA